MIGMLETFASFALVLGILVFVHEFGHFVVAKWLGIGVPVFSLGLGPRILGFRRGGTDYRISAIPLGGYVRLQGDESDEERTGAPEEFLTRPRWQRLLVFLSGATVNVLVALAVMWAVFFAYGIDEVKSPDEYPVVGAVLPDSTAAAAGLRRGDRVIAIDGKDARQPETFFNEILMSPGTRKAVTLEREGRRLQVQMNTGSDSKHHLGDPGVDLLRDDSDPPAVDRVTSDSPAERAGLRPGDRVLAALGKRGIREIELRALLEASAGKPVVLEIDRAGKVLSLTVVPRDEGGRGRIGVAFRPSGLVHRELTLGQAAAESWKLNVQYSKTLFLTLQKLMRGDISVRTFSGPIEIARFSRQAVQGLQSFLVFLAFISLQLGILNLMPIPVLDGGHVLILAIEGVMRRDLSDRVKERVMQAGFVFLLAFFCLVIYFDVIKTAF